MLLQNRILLLFFVELHSDHARQKFHEVPYKESIIF